MEYTCRKNTCNVNRIVNHLLNMYLYSSEWHATSSVAKGGRGGARAGFEADFLWNIENRSPHRKTAPPQTLEFLISGEKSVSKSVKTFFFFFGDYLILGGKNVWIYELSEKFSINFRTNCVKLIQEQWKFGSRSFANFSLFQNSPPLFQILATRLHATRAIEYVITAYVSLPSS